MSNSGERRAQHKCDDESIASTSWDVGPVLKSKAKTASSNDPVNFVGTGDPMATTPSRSTNDYDKKNACDCLKNGELQKPKKQTENGRNQDIKSQLYGAQINGQSSSNLSLAAKRDCELLAKENEHATSDNFLNVIRRNKNDSFDSNSSISGGSNASNCDSSRCCTRASTSQLPGISENSWKISKPTASQDQADQHKYSQRRSTAALSRRASAARLVDSCMPGERRHTVSNTGSRTKCGAKSTRENFSYDKNLAAAADTYFYFYSSTQNQATTLPNCQRLAKCGKAERVSMKKTLNKKKISVEILQKISASSGYHTYYEKFLAIRLCRVCQARWSRDLQILVNNNNDESCVESDKRAACKDGEYDLIASVKIIDFSSSSSSSISSIASPNGSPVCVESTGGNGGMKRVKSELKGPYDCRQNGDGDVDDDDNNGGPESTARQDRICNQSKRSKPKEHKHKRNKRPADLRQHSLTRFDNTRQNTASKSKAIFCPIITNSDGDAANSSLLHHCCGCHYFSCTTYPDKLSLVLSCDDAASIYLDKIKRLAKEQDCELPPADEMDDEKLPYFNYDSNSTTEEEYLRKFLELSFFYHSTLSYRFQVYNPHPSRFYCDIRDCLFCNFKRKRQPDDELLMKTAQAKANAFLRQMQFRPKFDEERVASNPTSSPTLSPSSLLLNEKPNKALTNVSVNSERDGVPTTHQSNEPIFNSQVLILKKDEYRKKSAPTFSGSSSSNSSTSMLAFPLLLIEEKILKLVRRFCNDPEEPNMGERCSACYTRRASVRAYPCGHQALCRLCCVTIIKNIVNEKNDVFRCVLCRRQVAVLRHQKRMKNIGTRNGTRSDKYLVVRDDKSPNVQNAYTPTTTTNALNLIFSTKLWPWNR